jgi:hypothetical protein
MTDSIFGVIIRRFLFTNLMNNIFYFYDSSGFKFLMYLHFTDWSLAFLSYKWTIIYISSNKMPLRIYTVNQKYVKNKHGEIGVYKKKIKKWIKSNKSYRPQKRGLEKVAVFSSRFGFLGRYNRKEQQELICPSGFSISQCFNVLRKLWYAYRRAVGTDNDRNKMKKYAKAIQGVQKDMGINTASFPHLRSVWRSFHPK